MTEMTEAVAAPPAAKPRRTLREALRLTRNPVVLKELRGRMRGARAFVLLSFHILVMSGFVTLLYTAYVASTSNVYSGLDRRLLGKFVFGGVVGIELLLVCFITPAFTVGAISGERERQTYDLLRTTLLSARALVFGKLVAALSFILLLLVAALPLQSLAFLLGGVAPEEVAIATLMLMTTAFLFGAAGLFFSSLMRRTLGATVLTYAFALLTTLGLPILLLATLPLIGLFGYSSAPPLLVQVVLLYVFGTLIATNPIATAIATEVILVEEQTAFFFSVPLYTSGGTTLHVPLVSPWLPFVLFCLILGTLLILFSVQVVRRAER
jgi:ABC-type transport system involved in multi-copper enzyme maturation permease subunit